mmetsp:Transcript_8788/g.28943  ORF Transcript_8788/g.28943 Transcript_8788/m.28943 type:complete len:273 (-) Transcript_8788:217-1035(-)
MRVRRAATRSERRSLSSARRDASSRSPKATAAAEMPHTRVRSRNCACADTPTASLLHRTPMASPRTFKDSKRCVLRSWRFWSSTAALISPDLPIPYSKLEKCACALSADANCACSSLDCAKRPATSDRRPASSRCSRKTSASNFVNLSSDKSRSPTCRKPWSRSNSKAAASFCSVECAASKRAKRSARKTFTRAHSSSMRIKACESRRSSTQAAPSCCSPSAAAAASHSRTRAMMSFLKTSRTSTSQASLALKVCVNSSDILSIWSLRSSTE